MTDTSGQGPGSFFQVPSEGDPEVLVGYMTNLMSIGDNIEDNGETRVRVSGVYYCRIPVARPVYLIFILYGLSVIPYFLHNMPIILIILTILINYTLNRYSVYYHYLGRTLESRI